MNLSSNSRRRRRKAVASETEEADLEKLFVVLKLLKRSLSSTKIAPTSLTWAFGNQQGCAQLLAILPNLIIRDFDPLRSSNWFLGINIQFWFSIVCWLVYSSFESWTLDDKSRVELDRSAKSLSPIFIKGQLTKLRVKNRELTKFRNFCCESNFITH